MYASFAFYVLYHFIIWHLEIEWATSIFQNSCFPPCLNPNYIIHTSHYLIFPHFIPSPTFFLFFFFWLWIQLQVTHLALLSSFGIKQRLFMNFARLVHILWSIFPYENGLTKEFKHKDQCPIYNASPSCFGKFLVKNLFELVFKMSHDI